MKLVEGVVFGATISVVVGVVIGIAAMVLNRPQMIVNEAGKCMNAVGHTGSIPCNTIAKKDYGRFDVIVAYSKPPK